MLQVSMKLNYAFKFYYCAKLQRIEKWLQKRGIRIKWLMGLPAPSNP